MRILVTGATGQVGRRFVPRLLQWRDAGDDVRVLVRDAARAEPFTALGAEAVLGDLREEGDRRKALAGADAVVHIAAAFRGVPDEEAWAVNRDAALALGREAAEEGVGRFVFVSTNLVYSAGLGRPAVESDPTDGDGFQTGAYPSAKAEAERGLLALHREGVLDVRIARLAFVYGEGDPHLRSALHWAPDWPAHLRLHMVHHADASQGLWLVLRSPGAAGRAYNIADDAPLTAYEILRLNGAEIPDGMAERELDDPWGSVVSNWRIRRELGFRPVFPSVYTALDAGAL
jgi:nucleoside-diphosphate-sugar epimerase